MTRNQVSSLFKNFTKIMDHRELNKEGVGLGLTISKNIAIALGGDIEVQSQVGKGSKFILWLPLHPNSQKGKKQIDEETSKN